MSVQIKVLTVKAIATAIGVGLSSFVIAAPLLAQDASVNGIEDETVAELLDENDCAILTDDGRIIQVDGANADTDGDGRAERFCTPARINWLSANEYFTEADILRKTDYNDDGEYTNDEKLIIDISNIISVRNVEPESYAIIISKTGVVTEANVIDIVEVSEEEARALLTEIERSRATVVQTQEVTPAPAPAPVPAPVPAPAPRVQPAPAPAPPVPALW